MYKRQEEATAILSLFYGNHDHIRGRWWHSQEVGDEDDDDEEPTQTPVRFIYASNALETIKCFVVHRNVSGEIMTRL